MNEQEHVPSPSVWPVTTGAGVALIGLGVVTIPALSVLGVLLLVVGLSGWIQELRRG